MLTSIKHIPRATLFRDIEQTLRRAALNAPEVEHDDRTRADFMAEFHFGTHRIRCVNSRPAILAVAEKYRKGASKKFLSYSLHPDGKLNSPLTLRRAHDADAKLAALEQECAE